ncbi:MAG: metal-sulfur cluster assembly factor [Candidatus Nanohaloarchaea archaeon]|mgnify:FL=1
MVTEEEVREQLKELMDPELDVNVVDLGLIYEIDVIDDRIEILMTLTTPACPMAGVFDEMVRQEVAHLEGINEVEVEITFDPKWTPEMVTEEGRDKLGHLPGMQAY